MLELTFETRKREEMQAITRVIEEAVQGTRVQDGICHLFVPHTTAALALTESLDPHVGEDLLKYLSWVAPKSGAYGHLEENAAAHVKAALVGASVALPIHQGALALGGWQGVFLCEFDGPRTRHVRVTVVS